MQWREVGGKELIREELHQEIFKCSEVNPGYAMGIWLVTAEEKEIESNPETRALKPTLGLTRIEGMAIAAGRGRQRLYVLPAQKMVIVRLGIPKWSRYATNPF